MNSSIGRTEHPQHSEILLCLKDSSNPARSPYQVARGEGDIYQGYGGMAKYGRGLIREIVGAVNQGIIDEPFSVADIRHFAQKCGWNIPERYVIVSLAKASGQDHRLTYKKYFQSLGNGQYQLVGKHRGFEWR